MKSKRNREDYHPCLLGAVAESLSLLLGPEDFGSAMNKALRLLGEASETDRVYVFENHPSVDGGEILTSQRYEWVREGVSVQMENPLLQNLSYAAFPHLLETLQAGRPYHGLARNFSEPERKILAPQQILSQAKMPISFEGQLWGYIGFDECHEERSWTEDELQTLRAAAVGIGGAIGRRKIEKSLQAQADELRRHRRVALSLTEDARRAEQEARASSQAKTIFLAMMSHEIRTPLNGVLGFTDLLLAENLTSEQNELAHTIRSCGDALFTLINDILDISRVEAGKLELNATRGSVEECAREVLASFDPQVREKKLTLSLSVAEGTPSILVDMGRFRQVLFNLVGNAVKFTAEGRVDVSFWTEPMEGKNVRICGRVSDTGPGISPNEQAYIFEPFRQANTTVHRRFGGSGLGLAICQRLTQAMGGGISVSSEPGRGTAFSFFVIAEAAEPIRPILEQKKSAVEGLPNPAGVRVLIVDDVPANLALTASFLRRLGYSTDIASDGTEAVKRRLESFYDLIFMDVLMPELDGCEATQRIRQHEVSSKDRSHIVALTADAMLENKARCLGAGMNDFITKPLRMEDIRMALKRWNDSLAAATPVKNGGEIGIA